MLRFTLKMKKRRNGIDRNPIWSLGKRYHTRAGRAVRDVVRETRHRHPARAPNPCFKRVFERVKVILRKPTDCAACGKSADCAKTPGHGVMHAMVWVCKRCWNAEMQERRNYNKRRGLFHGNPDRLLPHPWPKRHSITETRMLVER